MFLKTKEIVELTRTANKSFIFCNIQLWPASHVGEPEMFMKTKEIVELTWNVIENKRVVSKQTLNFSEIKHRTRFARVVT